MSGTMKALVKQREEKGLWLLDCPIPEVGEDDVLIKIKKTAICGTDMHIYNWDEWAQNVIPVPMIVGHEYGGEIVEVGAKVKNLKVGQRVSGEGHIVGGTSRNARAGKYHLDPDTKGVGVHIPGAFAEYLAIPAFNAVPLPDSVSYDVAAILDPLGNAVHTALSFDLVGEDVLITGAGPIGIMAALVARHAGARHVVLTDVNPYRLKLAKSMLDVTIVDVANQDIKDVMHKLGMTEGFDVGMEMSGVPSAFDQMVENMIMGGKIALLGFSAGKTEVDMQKIIFKALTIKGIYGREMFETWYKMLSILDSGLNVAPLITHRFDIEDFEKGFAAMQSGESGKVVLNWG